MNCFEINLEESKPFTCLEEQGGKKPMMKVSVKKEIPKGACVPEEIRDQNRSRKLDRLDLETIGCLNIVSSMDW